MLFDAPLTGDALTAMTMPVHVIEGSATSTVDHAICDVVLRRVPHTRHTVIEGAGHMMPLTHAPELTRILAAAVVGDRVSRAALAPSATTTMVCGGDRPSTLSPAARAPSPRR